MNCKFKMLSLNVCEIRLQALLHREAQHILAVARPSTRPGYISFCDARTAGAMNSTGLMGRRTGAGDV